MKTDVKASGASEREWIVLPLLSLLTIILVVGTTEWIARRLFRISETSSIACLVLNDPKTGVRAIPNSVCSQKILEESGTTEYRYNGSGHRAEVEAMPKEPGTYRIVLVGSSMALGLRVPREKTFAALLPLELSQESGRKVEVYNEAMQWGTPHSVDLRFNEALAVKPDLILWTVTPWDVQNVAMTLPPEAPESSKDRRADKSVRANRPSSSPASAWAKFRSLLHRARAKAADVVDNRVRSLFLLRHLLYLSQSEYLTHFLMQDEGAAFLRARSSSAWQSQIREFGVYIADIAARSKSASVKLVATALPDRAEAAMISRGTWPRGFDPYKFGEDVRSVIEKNGETYVDVLHQFRSVPHPEQFYLAIDGHPNAGGHAVFTKVLSKALTRGALPALSASGAMSEISRGSK